MTNSSHNFDKLNDSVSLNVEFFLVTSTLSETRGIGIEKHKKRKTHNDTASFNYQNYDWIWEKKRLTTDSIFFFK